MIFKKLLRIFIYLDSLRISKHVKNLFNISSNGSSDGEVIVYLANKFKDIDNNINSLNSKLDNIKIIVDTINENTKPSS